VDSALPQLKLRLGDEAEAVRICEQTKDEESDCNIHAYFNMYNPYREKKSLTAEP
jgi:hypothetical protein